MYLFSTKYVLVCILECLERTKCIYIDSFGNNYIGFCQFCISMIILDWVLTKMQLSLYCYINRIKALLRQTVLIWIS